MEKEDNFFHFETAADLLKNELPEYQTEDAFLA